MHGEHDIRAVVVLVLGLLACANQAGPVVGLPLNDAVAAPVNQGQSALVEHAERHEARVTRRATVAWKQEQCDRTLIRLRCQSRGFLGLIARDGGSAAKDRSDDGPRVLSSFRVSRNCIFNQSEPDNTIHSTGRWTSPERNSILVKKD